MNISLLRPFGCLPLTAALTLASCAEPPSQPVDGAPVLAEHSSQVVLGVTDNDDRYPWIVDVSGTFQCKGALIAPRWVLTAAHCISDSFGGTRVSYRRTDSRTGLTTSGEQRTGVGSAYPHPQFVVGSVGGGNDIGLIKLPQPFPADPLLQPAELPMVRSVVGQLGILASFSHTQVLPPGKVAVFRGQRRSGCLQAFDELCFQDPAASVCEGDSGSAVISQIGGRNYVTAVAARRAGSCSEAGGWLLATDVLVYLDWIVEKINSSPDFTARVHSYSSWLDFGLPSPWETIVGDFDGDRKADYARLGSTGAWVYYSAGDGTFFQTFSSYDELAFGVPSAWKTVTGDFDGDGRDDYARLGDTGAWTFYGTSLRTFERQFTYYNGLSFGAPSSWQSVSADFNGDGRDDYARLGDTGAWIYLGTTGRLPLVLFQDYAGLQFGLSSPWTPITGDFNGDGKEDYVRLGDTGAWAFYGSASGAFSTRFHSYDGLGFGLPSTWQVAAGDFNGDGRTDYARLGDTGAWIFLGAQSNSFARIFQDYDGLSFGSPSAWQVIAGDFDGTGRADYLRLGDAGAFAFFGQASGGFVGGFQSYPRSFGLPSQWKSMTGDFNGDGKVDYLRLSGAFSHVFLAR